MKGKWSKGAYFIFILFFMTVVVLGSIVFKDTRQSFFKRQKDLEITKNYQELINSEIASVAAQNFRNSKCPDTSLAISSKGNRIYVGSFTGEVISYNNKGEEIWNKNLGIGLIKELTLSLDDKIIAVGEESPDGSFYLLNAKNGEVLYKYSTVLDLGNNIKAKENPFVVNISAVKNGFVIAAQRNHMDKMRNRSYKSRCYKINTITKNLEKYPKDLNMDTTISKIVANDNGDKVVFGTSNWRPPENQKYLDTLYKISFNDNDKTEFKGSNNNEWSLSIPAVKPYVRTTLRDNPGLGVKGEYISAMTGDGRAYLVNNNGRILWSKVLSKAKNIKGVYLNSIGLETRIDSKSKKVVFALGNTHDRSNYRLPTPIEDENANTLFTYDFKGNLLFKTKVGEAGMIEDIEITDKLAVLSVGKDIKNRKIDKHGALVVDMNTGEEIAKIRTVGPCQIVRISKDSKYIALVEIPLQLNNGEIIGSYNLHLYKLNKEVSKNGNK